MPFKVVQTFEGKKNKLFTVPSGWEANNVLRYPNKCIQKYAKDENSTPTPDWEVIKCKVKRQNVISYEAGENLVSEMMKHSDTEEEVLHDTNNTQRRRLQNKTTLNLNSVAQDMMGNFILQNNKTNSVPSPAGLPTASNYNVTYIEDSQPNPTKTFHDLSNDKEIPLVQDSLSFIDIDKIFQNQRDILANQQTIVNQIVQNQQQQLEWNETIIAQIETLKNLHTNLIQKVSTLSVQLEDAVSQILSHDQGCQDVQTLGSSKSHIDNIPIHVKPVESAQQLDELEKQLSDPKTRDLLKNAYSVLCSEGKGADCAYMLVDVMFSRNFLCECSWGGGSRGDGTKVPLKGYKHVLSFFWTMVHFWDDTYTLQDNESFFKTILKNSKKRKIAKLERSSTSRRSKSTNKDKRVKLAEVNTNNEHDNYNSENKLNDEEKTIENDIENGEIDNVEIISSVQPNIERNKENIDSIEGNVEPNNERKKSVKKYMIENKESKDSVNSEKNIKEDEERNDSAEENETNDLQEIYPKENKKENKERNDSQEITPKETCV
ncbi:unnamed protein product [Plutella xylostella]|uniref:(diamondback moth) hypothetical protein n=1 Tax=Plutella xylostella TaxID=51655 RepID=A0A8S4GD15_PLUXY|nr:unnamed protein product [Plutella xylostella]